MEDVVEADGVAIDVLSSRFLNRRDREDAAYLAGQPPTGRNLAWFGVFLEVRNKSKTEKIMPALVIHDATGRTYSAFPSSHPQALQFSETLEPNSRLPRPGEQQGPDEGSLVIFRLGNAAVADQPLRLHVEGFPPQRDDLKLGKLEPF